MIEIVIVTRRRAWWKRAPKPTLRQLACAISDLQVAEGQALHAERDKCLPCTLMSEGARASARRVVPRRFLNDADWMHRHVQAPGMRRQARAEVAS